ncbi:MAG: PPA1309 family protein [Phycicoccus sp.]
MSPDATPVTDPLALAALETERHVAGAGWDQPMRLFALVPSAELVDREPHLAHSLARHDTVPGALSAVEQDDLPDGHRIDDVLARIAWPDEVAGCAVAVERVVIPTGAEHDLPGDEAGALAAVARHPLRKDVRLVVAVTRDGRSVCLLRQRDHDHDDRVAAGDNLAPGLVHALRDTLRPA